MAKKDNGGIDFPRDANGNIMLKNQAVARRLERLPEIPADQVGGVDWTFNAMFGGVESGIKMVESLVAGQGERADQRWILFLKAYQSRKEMALALGNSVPSLNAICHALEVPAVEFLATITGALRQLNVTLAHAKMAMALPTIADASIQAAMDPYEGGKEREMIYKATGVLEAGGGGVNVSVQNNNVAVASIKADDLKAPLRQFSHQVKELDNIARGDVIDAEIVEEG